MKLLLLLLAPTVQGLSVSVGVDRPDATPEMLSNEYGLRLPKLGSLIDPETLRQHIRRDLMPRLMGSEEDRTSYELGLNTFEKLHLSHGSLVELSQHVSKGETVSAETLLEKTEAFEDVDRDISLMSKTIEENKKNPVAYDTLRLMTNSLKGFECAVRATHVSLLSGKAASTCKMPFPGSMSLLGKKVEVPSSLLLMVPQKSDPMFKKPMKWMTKLMSEAMWCPGKADDTCHAVAAALDMPRSEDLDQERSSLAQITESFTQGEAFPGASVLLQTAAQIADEQFWTVTHMPANCEQKSQNGDKLSMHYTGTIHDTSATGTPGKQFDANVDGQSPFTFTLGQGQVIKGWETGLLNMCVGEKRNLVLPPELAYGSGGAGSVIPGGATLAFEVECVAINAPPNPPSLFKMMLQKRREALLQKEHELDQKLSAHQKRAVKKTAIDNQQCKSTCQRFGFSALGPEFSDINMPQECVKKCDEVYP